MAFLQVVPGLRLAAPRDAVTLREELREAIAVDDAPTVVRYPTGAVGPDLPPIERIDGVDVMRRDGDDVLLVAVGSMVGTCLDVAERCAQQGIGVTVVDPRWVKPVPPQIVRMAAGVRAVVVVEDGLRGGVSGAVAQALRDARVATPLRDFGVPLRFLDHAKRAEVLAEIGLTAQDIARDIVETVSEIDGRLTDSKMITEP
jgi:1-deoxy-D-xylulose-5-phosphate synthase